MMSNNDNGSIFKALIGVAVVGGLGFGAYTLFINKKFDSAASNANAHSKPAEPATPQNAPATPHATEKKSASFTDEQKKEIDALIEAYANEHPDVFINAINKSIQSQQEKISREIEKNASSMKDEIAKNSIVWGDANAPVKFYTLIDPMCPHCHELFRIMFAILEKRKDVNFTLLVVPVLGPNSLGVSKMMLAAALQSPDKSMNFVKKFIEKVNELDNQKLAQLIKDVGIDPARFEKDEKSEIIEKQLMTNVNILEKLKIPGVPTIFVENKNTLLIMPPTSIEGFTQIADRSIAGEDLTKTTLPNHAKPEKK
jgi:protein-disulfide isomerase